MATDIHVYIFYHYNCERPPEAGNTAKSRHPELMKYSSESGQCWLRPSVHTRDEEEKIPNPARIRTAAGDLAITSPCTDQTTSAFLLHTVLISLLLLLTGM
jgi:hypothetical protein